MFAQLAFGGADQAVTWNVAVGEQGKPPAGTPKGTSLNQFFPGRLTVNAGDKVTFSNLGFHTVTYLAGKPFPAFLGPAKGEVYEGIVGLDAGSRSSSTASRSSPTTPHSSPSPSGRR